MQETYYAIKEIKAKNMESVKNIRLHTHAEYEIHLFLQVNDKYLVEEKTYNVESMDMILIRKNQMHCMYYNYPFQPARIILTIDPEFFIVNNCQDYEVQFLEESTRLHNKIPAHRVKSSGLWDAFMRYKKYSKDFTLPCDTPVLNSIVIEILYLLNKISEFEEADDYNETIKQIIVYLNENYTKEITLDELCNKFYMSKYYLCRLFKKATGLSVFEYIRKKRLGIVKELTQKGMNKGDAATKAGFTNYTAFYRAYKSEYNSSPREGLRE